MRMVVVITLVEVVVRIVLEVVVVRMGVVEMGTIQKEGKKRKQNRKDTN